MLVWVRSFFRFAPFHGGRRQTSIKILVRVLFIPLSLGNNVPCDLPAELSASWVKANI